MLYLNVKDQAHAIFGHNDSMHVFLDELYRYLQGMPSLKGHEKACLVA